MNHPSWHSLDRLFAKELDPGKRASIELHLDDCESCRAYLDKLELENRELLRRMPPETLLQQLGLDEDWVEMGAPQTIPWWRTHAFAFAVPVCVAACLALLYVGRSPQTESTPAEVRWMGKASSVQVYAQRDGHTVSLGSDTPEVGDLLRFEVTLPSGSRGYAALLAEQDGEVVPLLPARLDASAFEVKGNLLLPGSVEFEPGGVVHLMLFLKRKPFLMEKLISEHRFGESWDEETGLIYQKTVHLEP